MKTIRIVWVDVAKFICIMCVINSYLESATDALRALYDPFFLSLFFFLSGFVYKNNDDIGNSFRKKIMQLFVPWLFFSVFNILLSQVISFNEHGPLGKELLWNLFQIRGHGDGLWFVAALFVTFIPFFFAVRWYEKSTTPKKTRLFIGICLALYMLSAVYELEMNPAWLPWNDVALPWHLEYIFIAMFFMVLGYLFRNKWEGYFDRINTAKFRWIIWSTYLSVIFFNMYLVDNAYFFVLMSLICKLLGMTAMISVCKLLSTNKLVSYIGQNTLLCFALHGKVYSITQTMLWKLMPDLYGAILKNAFVSSFFSILLAVAVCLVLLIPIWIINRFLPFLLGRKFFAQNKV